MADAILRPLGRDLTRKNESLTKCKSLPALQLEPEDGSVRFKCPKCGLTNTLIPLCMRCYQTSTTEAVLNTPRKRVSGNLISAVTNLQNPYGTTITEELPPTLSASPPSSSTSWTIAQGQPKAALTQTNESNGLQQLEPPSRVNQLVITRSRLSVDLYDHQGAVDAPSSSLRSSSESSDPQKHKERKEDKQMFSIRQSRSDRDATTRKYPPSPLQRDSTEHVSSVAMSHSTRPSLTQEAPTTSTSGAGSPPSSHFPLHSSSRHLRSRSRSLFSLSIAASRSAFTSASSSIDSNTTTTIPNNKSITASATTTMINAAKTLGRRMSSTTQLRTVDSTALATAITQVNIVSEHDRHEKNQMKHGNVIAGNDESSDHDDQSGGNRQLRRKKRLAHQPLPSASPPPRTSFSLRKEVSRASLHAPQPIAISFNLSQRPNTSGSTDSSNGGIVAHHEKDVNVALPMETGKQKGILRNPIAADTVSAMFGSTLLPAFTPTNELLGSKTPLEGEQVRSEQRLPPVARTSSDLAASRVNKPPADVPPSVSNHVAETPARPLSTPSPAIVMGAPSAPRVGHPSRPYYSAIRKHCMSSPTPSLSGSRPTSLSQPLTSTDAQASSSRPTSASIGPPPSSFTMQMPAITPFTRRPLSMGAVPVSTPIGSMSLLGSGSAGSATLGMSVFDVEDESDAVPDEDWPYSKGKDRHKSNSLSRAFGRAHGQRKKRRWSSGLFSEGGANGTASGATAQSHRSSQSGRRVSGGFNPDTIGISMSGETELRMALAMMEQQEEAQQASQREKQQPLDQGSVQQQEPESSPTQAHKDRKYRFRQTGDFGGGAGPHRRNSEGGSNAAQTEGDPSSTGMLARVRKFKRGLKGFLSHSHPGHSSSPSGSN